MSMRNNPPITHLLAITLALAALAAGAWFYTNANEPVDGIPEGMTEGLPEEEAPASRTACEDAGGVWNECASACPPEAEVCTLNCLAKCEGVNDGKVIFRVYYPNSKLGSNEDCTKVFPVKRAIGFHDIGPPWQVLLEPTDAEKAQGYFTAIPEGVELLKYSPLKGADGAMEFNLDFSEEMKNVAGSCRVQAIRAQIEQTVRDGYTGNERVIITVAGGDPDEALQP